MSSVSHVWQNPTKELTSPVAREPDHLLSVLRQPHDVAEDVGSEGRKKRACSEEQVCAVEAKQRSVHCLEDCGDMVSACHSYGARRRTCSKERSLRRRYGAPVPIIDLPCVVGVCYNADT